MPSSPAYAARSERLARILVHLRAGAWRVLVLALALAALAACQPAPPAIVPAEPVEAENRAAPVYVILPGGYSRYLAEGLMFASDGADEDLPVYPSAGEARRALRDLEAHAVHSRYVWRIFRLEADWNSDVAAPGGEYRLSGPARVVEMVED